jgi:acyl-CoA reductase-like NAD-dependent aldehyde dehydrogenase
VGAITPWNYPLHQIANKVAPALAAGCTIVLKPSEVTPLNAFILAEIIDDIGLPAGVFNLVTGTGPVVGEAIAAHHGVDMVSFTGSTRAGKRVGELAAQCVKPVALELGGKSPNVILEDADFEQAVTDGVGKAFLNSGQTCSALTRMLVPRSRLAEAEDIAVKAAETYTPGDPFDADTRLGGPARACARVHPEGHRRGRQTAHRWRRGARGPRQGVLRPADGFLRRPQRHDHRPGGDLRACPLDHPVRGRGGRRPHRQREVNGGAFNPLAPFGGFKRSGHGRELGKYALEEFLTTKSLQLEAVQM